MIPVPTRDNIVLPVEGPHSGLILIILELAKNKVLELLLNTSVNILPSV
jgi:hypothetical protein